MSHKIFISKNILIGVLYNFLIYISWVLFKDEIALVLLAVILIITEEAPGGVL